MSKILSVQDAILYRSYIHYNIGHPKCECIMNGLQPAELREKMLELWESHEELRRQLIESRNENKTWRDAHAAHQDTLPERPSYGEPSPTVDAFDEKEDE